MPIPNPSPQESRNDFISRCMEAIGGEFDNNDQAVAVCNSTWEDSRNFNMSSSNERLLEAIRNRKSKSDFNYGIITADCYVKTLQDCVGLDACYRFACKGSTSFEDALKKAEKTLTYNNKDMVLEDIYEKSVQLKDKDGNRIELPKNTLMVFRHVLTTPTKDRDGDILRTEGATVDPNMLLLWQHVPTLPIGKMLGVAEHTDKGLSLISSIVDINELSHDSAVMIENKMGRFSHGFSADEFKELEEEDDGKSFCGFDITKFSIMEESLVSIPANTDAETEEIILSMVDGGKFTSHLMKEVGSSIRERRPTSSSVKYRQKLGDFEETIEVSNAADFKTVFKETRNENESRSGSDKTKGTGKERSSDTSKETNGNKKETKVSKTEEVKSFMGKTGEERGHIHSVFIDDEGQGETSVNDGHSHQIHLWEVASEGDHVHTLDRGSLSRVSTDNISAKQAMAIFLAKSTSEQKQYMIKTLEAFEGIEKQSIRTEEYKALVGS